jgi:hypothetical protein
MTSPRPEWSQTLAHSRLHVGLTGDNRLVLDVITGEWPHGEIVRPSVVEWINADKHAQRAGLQPALNRQR